MSESKRLLKTFQHKANEFLADRINFIMKSKTNRVLVKRRNNSKLKVYQNSWFGYLRRHVFRRKGRSIMSFICFVTCSYQLICFTELYLKYETSVDADVVNDPDPALPAIVTCLNDQVLNYTMCEKSKEYCETTDKPKGDDSLAIITQSQYHLKLFAECAFVHYNNTKIYVALNICESSWVFNGYEPCAVVNVNWAKPIRYKDSYAEFMLKASTRYSLSDNLPFKVGINVNLQSPDEVPNRHRRSFFLLAGTINKAVFRKTVVYRMKEPYKTKCRDYQEIYNFTKEIKDLSQFMCFYVCVWETFNTSYGCVPTPRPFIPGYVACNRKVRDTCKHLLQKVWDDCVKDCPYDCKGDFYDYNINRLAIDIDLNSPFVFVFHELRGNTIVEYRHRPQFKPMEIFSNVGGYFGIWLGMSVPLFMDMTMDAVCRVYKGLRGKERRNFPRSNT